MRERERERGDPPHPKSIIPEGLCSVHIDSSFPVLGLHKVVFRLAVLSLRLQLLGQWKGCSYNYM